ncbi:CHAT domain-containing protein [Undibacterium umbellatum]|uniref:CHAT domain-containing protein n=2 Tax=cellular organisms TaxID=131567 RepID=A0ABR6ZGY2_9BURK|nr:CHAT domain-containing protein [Undibacterium umbellatum]MBC3910929.1 CHAT domain-containing protein [Undibacterium umbellatum]
MSGIQQRKQEIQGFDPAVLFGKGFDVGCIDLVVGGSLREVVGRIVATLLPQAKDKDGRSVFKGASILLPPVEATEVTEERVFAALLKATHELRGSPVDSEEEKVLRRIVQVLHVPSLVVADLIHTVQKQGQRRLIAIAEASRFRDLAVNLPAAFGATVTRLPEDHWTPHVTSLCQQLVPAVKGIDSYALVHVQELPPRKPANEQQLLSVDECYVLTLSYEGDMEELLSARSEAWVSMAVQGRLEEVEAELGALDISEGTKLHILVQLVNRMGRIGDTLDLLRRLQPHLPELPAQAAIQVAQFAAKAGDEDLAQELLPDSPNGIGDQIWLEEGLDVATQLEDNDRIAKFDARLEALVSSSERLRENRDRRLLMNCQEAKPGDEQRFTTAGFTVHHLELQKQLSGSQPDYDTVIKTAQGWGQEWLELAAVCCAMHARSVGRFREAADVASAITSSEVYGRQATQVLLYSIRAMMLRELVPKEEHDYYRGLFQSVFLFLARYPADEGIRSNLTSLLSVESCGDQGVPLVASTMLDLAERGVDLPLPETVPAETKTDLSNEEVKTSITNAIHWMGERGGGEPGVTVIPRELIVASPDDVISALGQLVQRASGQLGEDSDLDFMEKLVFIACAVCPYATQERDDDIRLMRLLASQFATSGQFQRARDFAEQILLIGQTSLLRQRLAWGALADIYHRCRNHVVALVGAACALATDVAVPKADLWHEVYAIHRILRDLGLFNLSRQFLPSMKKLLGGLGFDPDTDTRVVAAELGLQLMESRQTSLDGLQELLAKIAAASESALGDRNRLFPLAVLLGQTATKVEAAGGVVAPAIRVLLETALQQVGNKVANTIKTISAEKPVAADVLAMFNEVERAAFAADVARDYAYIGLAARRLLDASPQGATIASEAAFAVELLSDQTVKLLSDVPVMTVDWATQYAFELNDAGCDLVFMALDDKGELSVTHVADRQVRAIQQPRHYETFRRRFEAWLVEFPKHYGKVDREDGNNIFYLTMEQLDVRLPKAERLIIVAEPVLQQLTANLVVMKPDDGGWDYLAGAKSSIGMVPSLTWLAATRTARRSEKTGYKAWISAQLDSELENSEEPGNRNGVDARAADTAQTLDVALRRLSGSFEEYGFAVDTGRRLPRDMKDVSLAVVTAHGGLSSDGRYLRTIRDDNGLVEAPSALANALEGVDLVILFVCSGGRIDKNPWDNSTTSLPKQLLNGGSRAVIASPWPLNVLVTYNWLDPFLRAWESGATVLDATGTANDAVARHFGDVPQYSLAMRVYGDVLLTRQ